MDTNLEDVMKKVEKSAVVRLMHNDYEAGKSKSAILKWSEEDNKWTSKRKVGDFREIEVYGAVNSFSAADISTYKTSVLNIVCNF